MPPLLLFLATFLHEMSFLPRAGSSGLITVAHSEAEDAAPRTKIKPILMRFRAKYMDFIGLVNNKLYSNCSELHILASRLRLLLVSTEADGLTR